MTEDEFFKKWDGLEDRVHTLALEQHEVLQSILAWVNKPGSLTKLRLCPICGASYHKAGDSISDCTLVAVLRSGEAILTTRSEATARQVQQIQNTVQKVRRLTTGERKFQGSALVEGSEEVFAELIAEADQAIDEYIDRCMRDGKSVGLEL